MFLHLQHRKNKEPCIHHIQNKLLVNLKIELCHEKIPRGVSVVIADQSIDKKIRILMIPLLVDVLVAPSLTPVDNRFVLDGSLV